MSEGSSLESQRRNRLLGVLGWALLVGLGILLVWYGFFRSPGAGEPPATAQPSATVAATRPPSPTPLPSPTPPPSPTPLPMPSPTDTPPPTFAPEATAVPATPTAVGANLVAGENGVNVRTGPGTNYARIGSLDPGAEARITGRYGDWWQIEYGDGNGWVYGEIVTATNTEGVPEVQPPAAPTPVPATAAPAATATPTPQPTTSPSSDFRGLVVNAYWVDGAPGPFSVNQEIWFNIDISNGSSQRIQFYSLGTRADEVGNPAHYVYQQSYSYSEFQPGQHFTHRDRIIIEQPGKYNLWLQIGFSESEWVTLSGPIAVTVE